MTNRPKELQEFIDNVARIAFGAAPADVPGCCINCREPFSEKNVYTEAGRRETAISGLCEKCFDDMFKEQDDEPV